MLRSAVIGDIRRYVVAHGDTTIRNFGDVHKLHITNKDDFLSIGGVGAPSWSLDDLCELADALNADAAQKAAKPLTEPKPIPNIRLPYKDE